MTFTNSPIGNQASQSHDVVRSLYGFTKKLTRDKPEFVGGDNNAAGQFINDAYTCAGTARGAEPLSTEDHRQRGMVNALRGSAIFMRAVPDQIMKYTIGRGRKQADRNQTEPDYYSKVRGGHLGEVLRRHGVVGLALRGIGDGIGGCYAKVRGADVHDSRMKGREVVDIGMSAPRAIVAAAEDGVVALCGGIGWLVGPAFGTAVAGPKTDGTAAAEPKTEQTAAAEPKTEQTAAAEPKTDETAAATTDVEKTPTS